MKTVLLVEDDPHLLRVYRTLLESEGFRVLEAADGEAGAALAAEARPDCIVADTMMPRLDGIAMLERLAAEGHGAPTVMVSAVHRMPEMSVLSKLGVVRVFGKPFAFDEFLDAVKAVCVSEK